MTKQSIEADQFNTDLLHFQHQLAEQLKLQRFSTVQEKRTQNEVEQFLATSHYSFEREKKLSDKDIPDFLVHSPKGGTLVLEVKTRYQKKQIYRQLERYADHGSVNGLILLTGTSMGMPFEIKGKPTLIVSLGEGWL